MRVILINGMIGMNNWDIKSLCDFFRGQKRTEFTLGMNPDSI